MPSPVHRAGYVFRQTSRANDLAKRELTQRDPSQAAESLDEWVQSLDPKQARYEHHLFEALGAYATIEFVKLNLLARMLQAQDPRARAFATRITGRWHDRLDNPLALLAKRIVDDHPRVRMEAVVACSNITSTQSVEVAAGVVDQPADEWIEYSFGQTVHALKPFWMPAFKRGDMAPIRPSQLAAVLNETGDHDVLENFKKLIDLNDLEANSRSSAIVLILAVGGPNEFWAYGLDPKRFNRADG